MDYWYQWTHCHGLNSKMERKVRMSFGQVVNDGLNWMFNIVDFCIYINIEESNKSDYFVFDQAFNFDIMTMNLFKQN